MAKCEWVFVIISKQDRKWWAGVSVAICICMCIAIGGMFRHSFGSVFQFTCPSLMYYGVN